MRRFDKDLVGMKSFLIFLVVFLGESIYVIRVLKRMLMVLFILKIYYLNEINDVLGR